MIISSNDFQSMNGISNYLMINKRARYKNVSLSSRRGNEIFLY